MKQRIDMWSLMWHEFNVLIATTWVLYALRHAPHLASKETKLRSLLLLSRVQLAQVRTFFVLPSSKYSWMLNIHVLPFILPTLPPCWISIDCFCFVLGWVRTKSEVGVSWEWVSKTPCCYRVCLATSNLISCLGFPGFWGVWHILCRLVLISHCFFILLR